MLQLQRTLQTDTYGHKFLTEGQPPSEVDMEFIRTNVLAIIVELTEMMNETGWKPWATSNHVNVDAYRSELVDVFHFMMNLMLAGGMTADDLYEGYLMKRTLNVKRQVEGYDGVSGKCPSCHRAYDDSAVRCHPGVMCCDFTTRSEGLSDYREDHEKTCAGGIIQPWCSVSQGPVLL